MAIKKVQPSYILNNPAWMDRELSKLSPEETFQFFDDFVDQGITEAESPYVLNAGSDDAAIDPAINAQVGGVLRVTAGDGDGTAAVDGSQVVLALPVQASKSSLAFECRLNITDVSECSVFVGFTDSTSLEEPMSVSGTTLTTNATDAVGFVYDPAMTTDEWWLAGVDDDTDATGSGTTSVAPEDGEYQVFRVEVSADGQTAYGYIDGTLVGTLTANAVDPDTNVYFTVFANGTGSNSAAATVDVDYIVVEHAR